MPSVLAPLRRPGLRYGGWSGVPSPLDPDSWRPHCASTAAIAARTSPNWVWLRTGVKGVESWAAIEWSVSESAVEGRVRVPLTPRTRTMFMARLVKPRNTRSALARSRRRMVERVAQKVRPPVGRTHREWLIRAGEVTRGLIFSNTANGSFTQEEARSFIVSSLRRRLGLVASAACRTSACRGPSSSGACSAASSSEDRRRECRSTCRTPTSSSTRPARDGWPAARKRARTPRVPQGGRGARAPLRRSYTAY